MKSLIIIFIPLHLIFGQFGNNQSITKTGTTIAQFLKIGMDARSTAMGGAVAGQKANLSGVYWNPASIAGHKGIGIQFGSNAWLAAMKYQFASIGLDLNSKGIIGISVPRFLPERICWLFSKDYHNTPGGHVRIFKQKTLKQVVKTYRLSMLSFVRC